MQRLIALTTALLFMTAPVMAQDEPTTDAQSDARPHDGRPDHRPDHVNVTDRPDKDRPDKDRPDKDRPDTDERRAHDHARKAWEAMQDRIFRLEVMEFRAHKALADNGTNETHAAELEAKIARIQAAQNHLIERALNWRDDIADRFVVICHAGDDGEQTLRLPVEAAKRHIANHDDHRGACEDDGPPPELAALVEE